MPRVVATRAGGSAFCGTSSETEATHTDSVDILTEGALNSAGQLLYVEMTGPLSLSPPNGFHAELWLGDPQRLPARRRLLTLYRDHLGVVDITAGVINWLHEIQWSGTQDFFAIGELKRAAGADSALGIVHGTITAGGAALSVVAGGTGPNIRHFALIPGGTALVYVDTTCVGARASWSVPGSGRSSRPCRIDSRPAGRLTSAVAPTRAES